MEHPAASPRRSGMQVPLRAVVVFVLLLGGCSDSSGPGHSGGPTAAPPLEPRLQGTMTITPASATPGQEVALNFPADSVRGIAFSLSTWAEGAWTPVYFLTSDWGVPAEHQPSWWRVEDSEDRGWEQVAVEGDGPDRVVVPDAATAGDYLLCTANAADEACARLTVTD